MLEPKVILRFAVLAIVSFTVLMWPWEPWRRTYAAYFRGFGDAVFSQFWFWPQASVRFLDLHSPTLFDEVERVLGRSVPEQDRKNQRFQPEGIKDTLMILMTRGVGGGGVLRTASQGIGYWPTATVIALVLASPIPWRRKPLVAIVALVFVHMFIAVRLSLLLLTGGFADPEKKFALFKPGPFMQDCLSRMYTVLTDNPTVSFVVPVFVWLLSMILLHLWWNWREKSSERRARSSGGRSG